jgi:hypothetical protein
MSRSPESETSALHHSESVLTTVEVCEILRPADRRLASRFLWASPVSRPEGLGPKPISDKASAPVAPGRAERWWARHPR